MISSLRTLIIHLVQCAPIDELDKKPYVEIWRRDPDTRKATHTALVPIESVSLDADICIDESDIVWEPWTPTN